MKNKLIILALVTILVVPIKLLFSMKKEMPIYEILAEKKAKKQAREDYDKLMVAKKELEEDNTIELSAITLNKKPEELEKELEKTKDLSREAIIAEYEKKYKDKYIKDFEEIEKIAITMEGGSEETPIKIFYGNIDYFMSIDQMKDKIKKKLEQTKIISKQEFEKNKDKYYTHAPYPTNNLERIYVEKYLETMIKKTPDLKNYSTPEFIIVSDNPKNIKVVIKINDIVTSPYPEVYSLEGAKIYATNIEGPGVGSRDTHKNLIEIAHYEDLGRDAKKMQNIILDTKTKKYCVVDLERKSFDISKLLPKIPELSKEYFISRFHEMNKIPDLQQEIEVYPFR